MQDVKRMQGLTSAAGHLCLAYQELADAGYSGWSGELRVLIEIIDAEIEWLRGHEQTVQFIDQ